MVLDAALLSTQHYKVRIKRKVEQSWEWMVPFLHIGVVAIEKGTLGSPSTKVANFTLLDHCTTENNLNCESFHYSDLSIILESW